MTDTTNTKLEKDGLANTVKGDAKEVSGHIKHAVGTATDNTHLKVEGKVDEAAGKAQQILGKAERKSAD